MTNKPLLCIDFDGVLHSYTSGWKGAHFIPDPPTKGAMAFLVEAVKHFEVAIYSSRSGQEGGMKAMKSWIDYWLDVEFGWNHKDGADAVEAANTVRNNVQWPTEKPPAMVTIDDRALTFSGNWADYDMQRLLAFKPWNKKAPAPLARKGSGMRAAVQMIVDEQRSAHRETVSENNALEHFGRLNQNWVALHDRLQRILDETASDD